MPHALHPGVEPSGRVLAVVRAGGQLAVRGLRTAATPRGRTSSPRPRRGHRSRCRRPGTADRAPPTMRLLDREDPLVLVGGHVRLGEREHLDLVELVHAEDPRGVLAVVCRASRRKHVETPGVAWRKHPRGQALPSVQGRERDLARTDEEELRRRRRRRPGCGPSGRSRPPPSPARARVPAGSRA